MLDKSFSYVAIATRSYLSQVAVLAKSLSKIQPKARLTCYLVEKYFKDEDNFDNLFDIVLVDTLDIPQKNKIFFQYSAFHLCCALKPFILLDQLNKGRSEYVIYLDSDTKLYDSIEDIVLDEIEGFSALISPHLLYTENVSKLIEIRRAGLFNAGFFVFKRNQESYQILNWWSKNLIKNCIESPFGGVYLEQGWMDFMPVLFPEVKILRHRGINVGHWNFIERSFAKINDDIYINNTDKLYLFHFSGLKKDLNFKYISDGVYPDGYFLIKELAKEYLLDIEFFRNKQKNFEYSFSKFNNGQIITQEMRDCIRHDLIKIEDPFDNYAVISSISQSNMDLLYYYNVDFLLKKLSDFKRIENHNILGNIIKFWKKWINKNL